MAVKLDHRGWAAAQHVAPCVICHQPAITPRQAVPPGLRCGLGQRVPGLGPRARQQSRSLEAAPPLGEPSAYGAGPGTGRGHRPDGTAASDSTSVLVLKFQFR